MKESSDLAMIWRLYVVESDKQKNNNFEVNYLSLNVNNDESRIRNRQI